MMIIIIFIQLLFYYFVFLFYTARAECAKVTVTIVTIVTAWASECGEKPPPVIQSVAPYRIEHSSLSYRALLRKA